MGTHYVNRSEIIGLDDLIVEQIIYQAFDIVDKRRPNTDFKKLIRKIVRVRKDAYPDLPPHRVYQFIVNERFFTILQRVARAMSHGKIFLKEEDVENVTPDTPIHDFFDIIDRLYTAKEEKENVKQKRT